MNYLLTMKNGDEVLSQQEGTIKDTIRLVKQVIMAMSNLSDMDADMQTMSFIHQVDDIGAHSIKNKETGYSLVVQKQEDNNNGNNRS